jgi:hypothetical protein
MSFRWLPSDFMVFFVCAGVLFWLATTYVFRDAVFCLFADLMHVCAWFWCLYICDCDCACVCVCVCTRM